MKFIIGKKIEMTQVWQGEKVVAVTKIQAGPCPVVQLKNEKSDGYAAVQLGFGQRKEKNIKKPQIGRLKKAGIVSKDGKTNLRYYREFRVISLRESRATLSPSASGATNAAHANDAAHANKMQEGIEYLKVGDIVDASTFAVGDVVKVTGTSKGKGFQGGVKRHGWHGHNESHGTKDQVRTSGSIGAGGPQHVFKNKKMPGRMGNDRVTTSNLKIVQVDRPNNILYVSGAVPGARNGLVMIYGEGELKIVQPKVEAVKEEKKPKVEAETADGSKQTAEKAAEKKTIEMKAK